MTDLSQFRVFCFRVFSKLVAIVEVVWGYIAWKRWRSDTDCLRLLSKELSQGSFDEFPKKVLVVIPFRDKWELTEQCLESLWDQELQGNDLVILLVDNGSKEEETLLGVKSWLGKARKGFSVECLRLDIEFNFSVINNRAVEFGIKFSPDLILFLNNDIRLITRSSVANLIRAYGLNGQVGLLGCTLQYEDRKIQHLFVMPGCKIVGAHPFKGKRIDLEEPWFRGIRSVPAITGAVMLTSPLDFLGVGGFDESLPNCYQDVDLCLKYKHRGYIVATLPEVTMIHYETQTRKPTPHWDQVSYIQQKWGKLLLNHPDVPSCFSRWSEQIGYSLFKAPYPWWYLKSNRRDLALNK